MKLLSRQTECCHTNSMPRDSQILFSKTPSICHNVSMASSCPTTISSKSFWAKISLKRCVSFFQKYQMKQSSQQQRFRRSSEDVPHYPMNSAVYLISVSSMSHRISRLHRLFSTLVGVMDNTEPRIYSYTTFGVSLNNTSSFLMETSPTRKSESESHFFYAELPNTE